MSSRGGGERLSTTGGAVHPAVYPAIEPLRVYYWLLALVLAVVVLAARPSLVSAAGAEWCDIDPLVRITTPAGTTVQLHVVNSALGQQHHAALARADISATVVPSEDGRATRVRLEVQVPGDRFDSAFPTRSAVRTDPRPSGPVLATATGVSGTPMVLEFTIDVA